MKNQTNWMRLPGVGTALCVALIVSLPVVADDATPVRAMKLDPEAIAGIDLPDEELFIAPEDILEGNHRPRGKVLHYGEQLITEVYEDDPATFRFNEPAIFDEFITILSGKLILTGPDGVSQEFVAGDSLVVPKGFYGTWKMLGNYRELIVIERSAYEAEYGEPTD